MRQSTSNNPFLFLIIAGTLCFLCTIVGVTVTALVYEWQSRPQVNQPTEIRSEVLQIQSQDIDPALALAGLGGIDTDDVIAQAIRKLRPGTAMATLIYNPNISSRDTAGSLLIIGELFLQQNDLEKGQHAFRGAGMVATLSPDISDTARADIFIEVGIGLTKADAPELANFYLDQANLLSLESPFLQAARRQTVLQKLHKAYLAVGENQKAKLALENSMLPSDLQDLPHRAILLPLGQEIPFTEQILNAETSRQEAAQAVARDLVETSGSIQTINVQRLQNTLLIEDELKSAFFEQALNQEGSESQISTHIDILQAQIAWTSLKYQVAQQGFGLSIVPEWEANKIYIQDTLHLYYAERYRLYNEIIVGLPNADDLIRASEEAIRWQILAGKLGRYPNYPADILQVQLLNLASQSSSNHLQISQVRVAGLELYTLLNNPNRTPLSNTE